MSPASQVDPSLEAAAKKAALLSLDGYWKVQVNGLSVQYEWVHKAGSSTFTGEQVGEGSLTDASFDVSTFTLRWTVHSKMVDPARAVTFQAQLGTASKPFTLVGGTFWRTKSGQSLGSFSGTWTGPRPEMAKKRTTSPPSPIAPFEAIDPGLMDPFEVIYRGEDEGMDPFTGWTPPYHSPGHVGNMLLEGRHLQQKGDVLNAVEKYSYALEIAMSTNNASTRMLH
eukprot:1931066-Prymnesium_polylepis.1